MKITALSFFTSTILCLSAHAETTVPLHEGFSDIVPLLKAGGPHYSLTYVKGDARNTLKRLDTLIATLADVDEDLLNKPIPNSGLTTKDILKTFSLLSLGDAFGFTQKAAVGQSVTPIEEGFWHNRSIITYERNRSGLIDLLGEKTRPWQALGYAPSGTDLVIETQLDLQALLTISNSITGEFPDKLKQNLKETLAMEVIPGTGLTYEAIANNTKLDASLALKTLPDRTWKGPDGIEYPGFDLIGRLSGIKQYWPLLNAMLAGQLPPTEADGLITFSLPDMPSPLGEISPHLIYNTKEDILRFRLLGSPLDGLAKPETRLTADPAFVKAVKDLPTKGSSLIYVSKPFQKTLLNLALNVLKQKRFGSFSDPEKSTKFIQNAEPYIAAFHKSLTPISLVVASENKHLFLGMNGPFALKNTSNQFTQFYLGSVFIGAGVTAYDGFQRQAELHRQRNEESAAEDLEIGE